MKTPYNSEVAYKAYVNSKMPIEVSYVTYNEEHDAFYTNYYYCKTDTEFLELINVVKSYPVDIQELKLKTSVFNIQLNKFIEHPIQNVLKEYANFKIDIVKHKQLIQQRLKTKRSKKGSRSHYKNITKNITMTYIMQ